MLSTAPELPVDAVLPQLTLALRNHPCAILEAATGAGKTTRVPPALFAAGFAENGRILLIEPRRVAVRAAARRIAAENGWQIGRQIGYRIRFEDRSGPESRILILTDGVLLRWLQEDPLLEGVGTILFDELHERRLDTDLCLAMARRVQRDARPDLRLVAMSATLDAGPLAAFLGHCPVIASEGRLHPVEVSYLDRVDERTCSEQAASGVRRALDQVQGDILVFLPGVGEILRTAELLREAAQRRDLALLPLYGDLPPERQDAALEPCRQRKVVLATNVAETSITIEGIEAVVDTGLARILRYDPACGLDRLERTRISRASAHQRAGRAGRLKPGICLRLWTLAEHQGLREHEVPEIRRVDLAGAMLQLLAWGERRPAEFPWFEPPEAAPVERALELLGRLGANGRYGLSEMGRSMARLPVHPRLARLLVECQQLGHGAAGALVAALLAERSPFRRETPPGEALSELGPTASRGRVSRSDVLDTRDALRDFERSGRAGPSMASAFGRLHGGTARRILQGRDQLERIVRNQLGSASHAGEEDEALLRSLFAAFPDRLARRREAGSPRGVMVGGRGVRLIPQSAVQKAPLFVCVDLDAGHRGVHAEALVRQASEVEPGWLPADQLRTEVEVVFDETRERVVAWRRQRYEDLVLAESECALPEDRAAEVLAAAAAERLDSALPLNDKAVADLRSRLACLRSWRPELELPAFDDAELRRLLPILCAGKRSFAELRLVPLLEILEGSLAHHQLTVLDREAPERWPLPSGREARLLYQEGQPPILAARIQELFGMFETPRLAGGRIPVLLHLLAPNMRPQQITQDLASFWRETYAEVRRQLKGRYPKHAWPEDPLTAQARPVPSRRQ